MNNIYEQEIADGLESALNNNVVNCFAVANYEESKTIPALELDQAVEADIKLSVGNESDILDLFSISSVLVSTGWNKNDDVFVPLN